VIPSLALATVSGAAVFFMLVFLAALLRDAKRPRIQVVQRCKAIGSNLVSIERPYLHQFDRAA
jgi:hypothetical protein